jgi:hypothetical protein
VVSALPSVSANRIAVRGRQKLNAKLNDVLTLTSVTGYFRSQVKWNGSYSAGDVERPVMASHTDNEQVTRQLRLASRFDTPVNFVLGAFYQCATLDFGVPAVVAGPLAAGTLSRNMTLSCNRRRISPPIDRIGRCDPEIPTQ